MGAAFKYDYFRFKDSLSAATHDEFIEFINKPENTGKSFELLNGFILMMAGNATGTHHRICSFFMRKIGYYLEGKKCEVFQDINVHLFHDNIKDSKNVFQPDIMVGCDRDKVTNHGYEGSPEFVVEVISKSTARKDYIYKLAQYMEYGVKEYWIVDPFKNQIFVYLNDGPEEPPEVFAYTFNDTVKISVLDDLSIDFKEIMKIIR